MPAETKKVYGIGAEFPSAAALFRAAEKVRDEGFKKWDVHSPYPIHGMDQAMGLGKSWLSIVVFCGGLTGLTTAACVTLIPSTVLYKLVLHGKPVNFWTVAAFFPIFFELTVLFSAFASVFALLIFNQLPKWYHP